MQKKKFNFEAALLKAIIPVACIILISGCEQHARQKPPDHATGYEKTDSAKTAYTRDMVDNLKDPSCGMPLTAGIADTLHYNGKVYGFCSDECRDEFKKNPEALAKSAEMKK